MIGALERVEARVRLLLLARTAGAWRTDRVGSSPLVEGLESPTAACGRGVGRRLVELLTTLISGQGEQ